MNLLRRVALFALIAAAAIALITPHVSAKGNEYDAVCDHIEKEYEAKKVKIPFMWLARFAVGIARPAGVKAFKVTVYRDLKFSDASALNDDMKATMRNALSEEWIPLLRIRSEDGKHLYMNMRETGKNVKILLVSIEKEEAVVVRAKFNPDKLVSFIEDPRIFGISLGDSKDGR